MKHPKKTTHKCACNLAAACCSILVMLCCAAAGALPETAKLVPPETILLMNCDDFSQLRARFEETNFYRLYKDPAMAAFVEDAKAKLREQNQHPDNEYARIIADVGAWPQGKMAVAFVLNEQTKDADEPPILFITEWREQIDTAKEAVDKVVRKAIENGARRQSEDYRGVTVTAITQESSQTLSYCFIDDCLIGSSNQDVLKFVIAHIKGASSPTLADDADYVATVNTLRRQLGPTEGQIDTYVNIKQFIKTLVTEDMTGQARTTVDNLGIDNVTSLGCSINLAGEIGSSASGQVLLRIDGAKRGICKMLDVKSAALTTPRFIPDATCSLSFLNLNIQDAYNELANILNSFSPQFAALLYMPLLPPSPQGEPGLQLRTDIIDHLGSQIVIAQSIIKPASGVGTPGPTGDAAFGAVQTITALAINNRTALEQSLSLLHSKILAPNNPDAKHELLGHAIYSIDVATFVPAFAQRQPTQPGGEPAAPPKGPEFAFTVTDTHFIFGSKAGVEKAIRTLSSAETVPMGSKEWFTKAKAAIPSAVGLAGLQDNTVSSEQIWTMLRESQARKQTAGDSQNEISIGVGSGSLFPIMDLSQDVINFSLLPEFETVRKYFGLSASYGVSRPDGFFFEFKYLNPDSAE